jgi:hypothetical protein
MYRYISRFLLSFSKQIKSIFSLILFNMFKPALSFVPLIFALLSTAQSTSVLSGFVEDANSGERLVGASVWIDGSNTGTTTNAYGFFSIGLKPDDVLNCSFIGYKSKQVAGASISPLTIRLSPLSSTIDEVTITAQRQNNAMGLSMVSIAPSELQTIPLILGENDILKAYQLMPGVQGGTEGTAGMMVRGSDPSQNLYLLDGVPVYNINHLFGLFSVFNTDAIKSSNLIKGAFPAKYGGRTASVMEIIMKEGSSETLSGSFSLGLISAKALLEGPINDKTTFMVSGRSSYINLFAYPYFKFVLNDGGMWLYNFYDVNAKINHRINDKHRLYMSYYRGSDEYSFKQTEANENEKMVYGNQMKWGNHTGTIRWNNLLSNRLFSNTTFYFSQYKFLSGNHNELDPNDKSQPAESFSSEIASGIVDLGAKIDFDYRAGENSSLQFGISAINHWFMPGFSVTDFKSLGELIEADSYKTDSTYVNQEMAAYIETRVDVSRSLKTVAGLRSNMYHTGADPHFTLEPRLNIIITPFKKAIITAGYARTSQNIHLLANSSIGFPTDQWVPITNTVKPIIGNQVNLSFSYNLNLFMLDVEGFYKTMQNVISYEENADLRLNWESIVEQGNGFAKGLEFLLRKERGKLTGWLAYTWSKSDLHFDNINNGEWFPYKYDRRHDVKITGNYKFSNKVDFSATWVFNTGHAVTLPLGLYEASFSTISTKRGHLLEIPYYEKKNDFRMPPYHRLDLALNFHKEKQRFDRTLSLGLYNAYKNHNAFYYDFFDGKLRSNGVIPLVPSIDYKIKF